MRSSGAFQELLESGCAHALGSLDREAERTVPDERGEDTEGARHAEENGVVVHLRHLVVLQRETEERSKMLSLTTVP